MIQKKHILQTVLIKNFRPDLHVRVLNGQIDLGDAVGVMKRQDRDCYWPFIERHPIVRQEVDELWEFMKDKNLA